MNKQTSFLLLLESGIQRKYLYLVGLIYSFLSIYQRIDFKNPMTSNQEAQVDELLALSSIYDKDVFSVSEDNKLQSGYFNAHLESPQPFHIIPPIKVVGGIGENYVVQHLPPLILQFQLPADYPSISQPHYTLSCIWLKEEQSSKLKNHLHVLWKDNQNEVILFHWIQFLLEKALQFLNITSPLDLQEINHLATIPEHQLLKKDDATNSGRFSNLSDIENTQSLEPVSLTQDCLNSANLFSQIIEYDKTRRKEIFDKTVFSCKVCFQERLGSQCINFNSCDHVFCNDCMQGYFKVLIKEGNVRQLNCPQDKCPSQAIPSEVRQLVGKELFDKYDQLLLSSTLDTMSDVMYCPRISCQYPVIIEPNSTMGCCSNCCFVFCIFCKYTYHGIVPCDFRFEKKKTAEFEENGTAEFEEDETEFEDKRKLYQEYMAAKGEDKNLLECRYGKRYLRKIAEELLTEKWLESNYKKCPQCSATIEKISGCNKMHCLKCNTVFCWLCLSTLSYVNPYGHYEDDPNNPCFNRVSH